MEREALEDLKCGRVGISEFQGRKISELKHTLKNSIWYMEQTLKCEDHDENTRKCGGKVWVSHASSMARRTKDKEVITPNT